MAKSKAPQFKDPWGWSKLDVYRGCPAQFKFKFIDKLREPKSPALERGTKVHDGLEMFLNGWGPNIPEEVNPFWKKPLERLKKIEPKTEAAWGVDRNWKPLPNWFHEDTWIRAKSDVYYIEGDLLVLIDFKTGKYRIPSEDQNRLYAIIGAAMFPQVGRVRTSFWFVDQAEPPHEEVYDVKMLEKLRGQFDKEAEKLYVDRSFKPKPGSPCRYCPFSRQKNGPCQY